MDHSILEPDLKRRKIRKGTRSCWECKGRKVKCTYMTPEDDVCDGCIRRGSSCVSQELPAQPLAPIDRRRQIGNRMVRVEALIDRLVKEVGDRPPVPGTSTSESRDSCSTGVPTPSSGGAPPTPRTTATLRPDADAVTPGSTALDPSSADALNVRSGSVKYQEISRSLLAVLPSAESVNKIVELAGPIPSFFHQMVRKPYPELQLGEKEKQEQLAELTTRHTPNTHPLIIARQMLLLAISFRYIHPDFHHKLTGFAEPPTTAMQRVAETAIDLITTNDRMIGTIDGVECLLLTSTFQADSGNLRSGWSATRRAMFLAQLLGLHRQTRPPLKSVQPGDKWHPRFLWYRIVYYDRFFSLILGLPQGSADNSMGSGSLFESDTPMGRLERRHCVLAGRILQRNEADPSLDRFTDTQAIDTELRRLSESMPGKWWLIPNLASIQDGDQLFWETVKLTNQVFHYILLSHLHLPFLLHTSSSGPQHPYEYSRVTCVNASRDLLHRYMAFRTFNRVSYCCHSMDFFAITASMTLLLAQVDGHRSKRDSDKAILHQRTSDRAIIEEILDNMEQVGILNKAKTLSERGAGVLRRLLAIEADIARGPSFDLSEGAGHPSDDRALRLIIPYFGVINIMPDGQISREVHVSSPIGPNNETHLLEETLQQGSSRKTPSYSPNGDPYIALQEQGIQQPSLEGGDKQSLSTVSGAQAAQSSDFVSGFQGPVEDLVLERSFNSDLTAAQENWAFPGVDMTFFDALMTESDAQVNENGDSWWLF